MNSRPGSESRISAEHRRSVSGGHQGPCQNPSDSIQSIQNKYGHGRSKSGVYERETSGMSQKQEFHRNQVAQGDGNHSKRPRSLYPLRQNDSGIVGHDQLQPERELIHFDVNLVGAPPEVEQLVNNIKQVAEHFLYHWKTFPIVLPSPVSHGDSLNASQVIREENEGSQDGEKMKYHVRDLFIATSFDELDAVAVDAKGEPKKLTNKQLEYIRERGYFEVESLNFPGQQHRWRLSQLLQKGTVNTHNSLLNDLALALRFIVVTAKNRIVSHFFSLSQAARALLAGFLRILDVLIGLPSLQAHNLDAKIREERNKYLVAELICRPENEESLELLCSFVRKQLRKAKTEKIDVTKEYCQPPAALPYKFLTPSGTELDLRLWDKTLMRKALPILVSILERETRGWFLHFRERLIAELRAQKMPDEDIEREVNEAVMKEYLQRVYNSILSHPDIINLGEGTAQLLVQQAQSVVLMHRAVENVQHRLQKTQEEFRTRLCNYHSVLSRIGPWLRSKLRTAERKFIVENQWSAHEDALTLCVSQRLLQTVYFLNRDLTFMKEQEPALLRELRKDKVPTRTFEWPMRVWFPTHWVIRRNFQGESEVVPTVLSQQVTSITTPRSDPSQPVFLVEKEIIRTTTTRWPLWRIFNYCHRTWCWTWNAMFLFGIVLPWCSPLGLRALLYTEPFMPDLELSQVNGMLFPKKSSLTLTLTSRLITLWKHISKSRTKFETKPDTGFIGKDFTRHVNRLWNYFIKGFFGTVGLVVIFPVVCFAVILTSLFVASTAVLWMPLLTLTVQLTNMLIYDLDSPEPSRNRYAVLCEAILWNIGIQGLLQPVAALFVAIFLCPAITLLILGGGIARYWLRLLWDTATFHLIIRKRGRIPASDSFVVKRIAGPGLASDYYFQISPEQALAAFEAKMEWDELAAYQLVMENTILQPQRDFSHFVEACFGSFSVQLAKNGPYKSLEREAHDLLSMLHEKLERRRRDLQTGLSVTVKSKIKLTTSELKIAIQQGALILERFYPTHILPKLGYTEEQFWESRNLSPGDWAGLAGLLYTEIFSLDFLTPLDHADTSFRLEPHPQADLSRYTTMVQCAQLGAGGPDLLGNVYTPRGNIQVHSPYLDVSAFNPRLKSCVTVKKKMEKKVESMATLGSLRIGSTILRMPWKKHSRPFTPDKMVIPLPIPHPAHIAITIYNRDSDDPIPLESDLCQSILRGIEESHVSPDDSGIGGSRLRPGHVHSYSTDEESSSEAPPYSPRRGATTDEDADDEGGATSTVEKTATETGTGAVYQWTLSNWGQRRRNNSGSVRVDLASPEDVTLDSDSTRVVFCTYGTTV